MIHAEWCTTSPVIFLPFTSPLKRNKVPLELCFILTTPLSECDSLLSSEFSSSQPFNALGFSNREMNSSTATQTGPILSGEHCRKCGPHKYQLCRCFLTPLLVMPVHQPSTQLAFLVETLVSRSQSRYRNPPNRRPLPNNLFNTTAVAACCNAAVAGYSWCLTFFSRLYFWTFRFHHLSDTRCLTL